MNSFCALKIILKIQTILDIIKTEQTELQKFDDELEKSSGI